MSKLFEINKNEMIQNTTEGLPPNIYRVTHMAEKFSLMRHMNQSLLPKIHKQGYIYIYISTFDSKRGEIIIAAQTSLRHISRCVQIL